MSKATINDVLDVGFRPEQFGFPTGAADEWKGAAGYIDRVLQSASRWAADKVGAATYDAVAADTFAFDCLVRAERCYCSAELYTRRVAFLDSAGAISAGARDVQYLDRREMIAHAQASRECMMEAIADAIRATGGDPAAVIDGVGVSFGHIETGMFPIAEAGAING